jgi:putative alpha-1,2-mannosidase
MYHTMLMPTDRTGENPDWKSDEPYYDDYYAIWDTYRSSGPLLTLIAPDRQRDIVRSLIDIYRHTGYMPDARSGNDNGRTQGGSQRQRRRRGRLGQRASRASTTRPPSPPC